jgi:biopolymer transport protein ExbD
MGVKGLGAEPSGDETGSQAIINDINVTPFVDVVLVLLVIFMVTAPAFLKDRIGIQLPKAMQAESKGPESIGVAVNREGRILINGQFVSHEELKQKAAEALQANPAIQALISADREAKHGDVVTAIDLIRSAGIQRFAVQIERKPE